MSMSMSMSMSMTAAARTIVEQGVFYNVSTLIAFLRMNQESLDFYDQGALDRLGVAYNVSYDPAEAQGWSRVPSDKTLFTDGDEIFLADKDDYVALAEHLGLFLGRFPSSDAEFLCGEEGWYDSEAVFWSESSGKFSQADSWEELYEERVIAPNEAEAHEHWLVSGWLGDKLRERGYTVERLLGLEIWARGTTGQAIYMDSSIRKIARDLEWSDTTGSRRSA